MGLLSSIFGSNDSSSKSTSSNTTANTTNTTTQDRRLVVDGGGIGFSLDGSTVGFTNDSNNTINSYSTDLGAVRAASDMAARAIDLAAQSSNHVLSASSKLDSTSLAMLQHSDDLAKSLTSGANDLTKSLLSGVFDFMGSALKNDQQTLQIASNLATTPTKSQDPNRYLIAGGLAVVAIVAVMALKGR